MKKDDCLQRAVGMRAAVPAAGLDINPLMPNGAFNICCPRDCVSRHNGGTSGAPL